LDNTDVISGPGPEMFRCASFFMG